MQEGMEGYDPEIQRQIESKREFLEKLRAQIEIKDQERNQTKMIQMQQPMSQDDQDMGDGMRDGDDEQ